MACRAVVRQDGAEMETEHSIHVEFARVADRSGALRMLAARGFGAVAHERRAVVEVGCRPGEEQLVLDEVSHALDEWLRARGLPFTTARTSASTLYVRPPSD